MANKVARRKCLHCGVLFRPDPRNATHQHYCSQPDCRKASKAASQRRWFQREENRHYFQGPEQVQRVQEWRRQHPGYRRSQTSPEAPALQDLLTEKTIENPMVESIFPDPVYKISGARNPLFWLA